MRVPAEEANAWIDAGTWHDALRDAPLEELRRITGDRTSPDGLIHGPAVAIKLEEEGEKRKGLLDAIRYHTVGHARWDRTGRALYMMPHERVQKSLETRTIEIAPLAYMAPRRTSVFRHIEFLRLSEKRLLVIIVSPDGDVQNRVIFPEADYSQSQLVEASNYINANYAGLTIEQVRDRLQSEIEKLRGEIATLMQAAVQVSSEVLTEAQEDDVVISGERNLLAVSDFSSDMSTPMRVSSSAADFEPRVLASRCSSWIRKSRRLPISPPFLSRRSISSRCEFSRVSSSATSMRMANAVASVSARS